MRYFKRTLLVIFILGVMIHFTVWLVDHNLYQDLRTQADQNKKTKLVRIGALRRSLEARQKKELESYGWTEKEKGIARIPVTRATSYYLRTLPRK